MTKTRFLCALIGSIVAVLGVLLAGYRLILAHDPEGASKTIIMAAIVAGFLFNSDDAQ